MLAAVACASPHDGVVRGSGASYPAGYVPPLVANGELAMTVDASFGVRDAKAKLQELKEWLAART